jgi:hypothetical protein
VTTTPTTKGIGNTPEDPTACTIKLLNTFDGIDRP